MTIEKLNTDMISAMKAKDKLRKDTLSAVIGAIKKAAIDRKCKDNITEALVDEIVLKELKTASEAPVSSGGTDGHDNCINCCNNY